MPKIINRRPEKYNTISEASKIIGVPTHVLRFWEKEFIQIKPYKYKNRRYYLQKDIDVIQKIKNLLYIQGYTIEGAKKHLRHPSKHEPEPINLIENDKNSHATTDAAIELTSPVSNIVKQGQNPPTKAIVEIVNKLKKIQERLKNK